MNVARHLVQQDIAVLFASRIGVDDPGNRLLEFLKENGLYSSLIQQDDDLPTCEVTVQLDKDGQATYIIPEPVSWDNIQTETALTEAAEQAKAIIFGSLASRESVTRDTLLNVLDETTALKVFDVNLRPPHYSLSTIETFAAKADVLKMNEDEAILLSGSGNNSLKDSIITFQKMYHPQTICVTRGANGAIVWHDHEFFEHPGFKITVADTVGAGDAFLAAFVVGLVNQLPMPQILEKSCATGAFVAGKRGANPLYGDATMSYQRNNT